MLAPLSRPSLSGLSSVNDPQEASSGVSAKALSKGKRSGVGLDQVSSLLSNHDRRGVCVATHDRGHDRSIYDSEPLDTVYAQSSIDHSQRVLTHPTRAYRMIAGFGVVADIVAERLIDLRLRVRANLFTPECIERFGFGQTARELDTF